MSNTKAPGSETHRLARLLSARSVAVVGASSDPTKISGRPIAYMKRQGFYGEILPVNPSRPEIQGLRSYPSLSAIGHPVDLVIIGTPGEMVEGIVREGISAGARGFVIFSSGFAESGEDGRKLQERLSQLARETGTAIIGPNCLGIISAPSGLVASFTTALEENLTKEGGFSFVSQSGALAAYWLDMISSAGLGFRHWISTGNESDVDLAESVEFLADDEGTQVIGLYVEDVKNTERFRQALKKAANAGKPVFAIKAGRSSSGAAAAASHTGALAGDDALYQACFDQYGVSRVDSLSEMIGAAKLYAMNSVPRGDRVGILSVSGGAGVLLADECDHHDLLVTPYEASTLQKLSALLPAFGTAGNPLDLTGSVLQNTAMFEGTLDAIGHDQNIDIGVLFIGLMHSISASLTQSILQTKAATGKPFVVVWTGARKNSIERLEAANIPVFTDIPEAIRALGLVRSSERRRQKAALSLDVSIGSGRYGGPTTDLSEVDGKALIAKQFPDIVPSGFLAKYDADLEKIQFDPNQRYVLKLQSSWLLHKSDVGAVRLGVKPEDIQTVFENLISLGWQLQINFQGVLIEPMVPFDHELVLGLRKDPTFGPILTVGRGGTAVEMDPDVCIRLLPLSTDEVRKMLEGLRFARMLRGFRGKPGADIPAVAKQISNLANWFANDETLAEVEINPLVVCGSDVRVLDALIRTYK